jgi:hypothetical protein
MKLNSQPHHHYPFVKLPEQTELVLYLLREELKTTRLFSGLAKAGLEDCYFRPYFSKLVLAYCGFDTVSDNLMEFYIGRLDHYGELLEPDNDSVMECALSLYSDLMERKKQNR